MSDDQISRSQDDILARIVKVTAGDPFGFRLDLLARSLDYQTAVRGDIISAHVTERPGGRPPGRKELLDGAHEYLHQAREKILGHRRTTTLRAAGRLTESAWLLGRDDIVTAMSGASVGQYHCGPVKVFGEGFGWWVEDGIPPDPRLDRMAAGLPCNPHCLEGCIR